MGMGATDTLGRVMASLGMLDQVPVHFEPAADVAGAGVLLSIPALLGNGLLKHTDRFFQLPRGYYGIWSIFLLVALMALARLKHPEALRYHAPGEWGKLLGLDRVPEVRTLRRKLATLGEQEQVQAWSAQLCEDWMVSNSEAAAVLYVDGHVRVYHGQQTKLPRHYVTRERLCLRATTDYWVNAMDGQPFFLLNQPVDPGMLKVLTHQIIPRLDQDIPNQPTQEQLEADPLRHRFTVVFDREGYSPDFLLACKEQRIACLTYHKHPGPDWPEQEFSEHRVSVGNAPAMTMNLAERGLRLSNGLWVREVRKRSESGHQVSILSTDYRTDLAPIAGCMFARWTQENFFRYMREHYGLDSLTDHQTEALDATIQVVNPAWRRLDSQVRSKLALLHRALAQFGALQLNGPIEPARVKRYERDKAELQQKAACLQADVDALKAQRKNTPHHILVADLPEEDRFRRLSSRTKDFLDTIKMIAYRAETAMAYTLRETMSRLDDARTLLRQLYRTEADLLPDSQSKTLTVRIHHLASRSADTAAAYLCDELNATETLFPGTDLRLVYEIGPPQNPRGQEP